MTRFSKVLSIILAVAIATPSLGAGYQIKQSTTAYPLLFFMVDSTDHVSGKTGLSPTVTISKSGAAFGSPAGSVTEIANGWYKVAGNATDSGTLGPLVLHATGTAADATDAMFEVVSYDPQDSVRLGLTALPNAAAGANGGLPTGDASGRVDVSKLAGSAIQQTGGFIKSIESAKRQIWYVAASGGNDSNSGLLRSAPFATIAHAQAVANPGDTIWMVAGTYSTTISSSVNGIIYQGDGYDSTVVTSGSGTFANSGNGVALKDVTITTTNAASTAIDNNSLGFLLERTKWNGQFDGLFDHGTSIGTRVVDSYGSSTYDTCVFGGRGFLLDNSYMFNDGSHGAAESSSALQIQSGASGRVLGSTCEIQSSSVKNTGTQMLACTAVDAAVLFQGTTFKAIGLGATNAAKVTCVGTYGSTCTPTFMGSDFVRVNIGTGGGYQLDPTSAGHAVVMGGNYDASTFNNRANIYIQDGPLRPATNARDAVVDVSGLIDANAVKLGPSGSGTAQTARDIGANVAMSTAERNSTADAILARTNGSSTVGTQLAAAASANSVSPFIVDDDHTWSFDSRTQLTSPDILSESVGEATIYKAMDFSEALTANGSIASITSVTVADVANATKPTVTTSAISSDKKKVHVTLSAASATAATYTVKISIVSTDSRTFTRYGKLNLPQ
jgi:hypothetical protein